MFHRIRKLFHLTADPVTVAPTFGELTLVPGAKGPYWLHEVPKGMSGLTISICTRAGELPTKDQVRFFEAIVSNEEATYARVGARLNSEHEKMHHKGVPADWRLAFKLSGITVPLDGDALTPWDITYKCLTDGTLYLYTCYFDKGAVDHVSVDT